MLKKDLEITADRLRLIYAILRRAIKGLTEPEDKVFTIKDLRNICDEIECKDFKELKALHKKWIGY